MINTNNITTYKLNSENANAKERQTFYRVIDELGFFDKKRLLKIDEIIRKTIITIYSDSLWNYTYPGEFTYLSDFHFDPAKQEIVYVVNRVAANEEGYFLSENPTEREIAFFNKYQEFLRKLFEHEQKRSAIYRAHSAESHDNVIAISDITTRKQRIENNKDKNFIVGFTNHQLTDFIKKYHTEGIRRLIQLLNDLANSDKPHQIYNQMKTELSGEYIQDLLEWAAIYTSKAQYLLDVIAEERMNRFYQIAGMPSYEDRMTDNILKLL